VLPDGTRSFTFPSSDFENGGGGYTSGPRTVFLQAIDDGGMASTPVSFTWWVKAPVTGTEARLLLIDDMPSRIPSAIAYDTLYYHAAETIGWDKVTVLDLERLRPFRSAADLEQTFKLFRAVVWYRETNDSAATIIQNFESGIGSYLNAGGRFYLSGRNLVPGENSNGWLSESFMRDHLGSDFLHKAPIPGQLDSTVSWDVSTGRTLWSTAPADSMRASFTSIQARGFGVRDTDWVAAWARVGALTPSNPIDIPVGVRVPQPNGGKAIVLSFSLRGMNQLGTAARILRNIFVELGVYDP
jgi:hypothetical protein